MVPLKAHQAAIAAASDGSVLINVVGLLPAEMRAQLSKELGSTALFIGLPLSHQDASDVVARLDGAAAEASAHLLGGRNNGSTRPPPRPRKRAKSRAKRPARR